MTMLVTPDEMQAAENAVIASGIPAPELMRRAAESIADWLARHIPERDSNPRVAVAFVGPGNNGGDALVALALLHEHGWTTRAIFLGCKDLDELPARNDSLRAIERVGIQEIGIPDVILDGVYGFRSRASLPGHVIEAFAIARERRLMYSVPLVSIDVPSGIDAETGAADENAFPADVTLCLGLPKIGLVTSPAAEFVGELELLPIGIPALESFDNRPALLTEDMVRPLLPRRSAFAHKHDTGTALIVGGAPTYFGAPRLAAEAAARAGAGLVCAAIPRAVVPVIASQVPEAVLLPLEDSDGHASAATINRYLAARTGGTVAIAIGPGLGRDERAISLLDDFFEHYGTAQHTRKHPLVIVADALYWLSDRQSMPDGVPEGSAVLTPHAGEIARLLHCEWADIARDPHGATIEAARRYRQIVLLKRGYSIVAEPDGRSWFGPRTTPELATAGTGDVLAGLVCGLVAQGTSLLKAALCGVYIGATAGKCARRRHGTSGVVARDVIQRIPRVMGSLTEPRIRNDLLSDEYEGTRAES